MIPNMLISRAASVYPDAYVLSYWDSEKQEPKANPAGGDTLAQFVAQELSDTFDPEADETEQIAAAVKAMRDAADDLLAVAFSIERMGVERQAA